jgi:predicted enzyme related to lactoylglutathione lyase
MELQTKDVDRAKKFYGSLFDWKLEDAPDGPVPYTMIKTADSPAAGS